MKRTKRACIKCGKPFYGGTDKSYCDECAKAMLCVQERVNRAELNFWGVHVHPIVRTVAE